MELENKPEQTDPSVNVDEQKNQQQEQETVVSKEEETLQKVGEVIKEQKSSGDPTLQSIKEGGSSSNVSPEEDSSKLDNTKDVLDFVQNVTGRAFDSVDAVRKYLENLNSFVGDQKIAQIRNDSQLLENLVKGLSESKNVSKEKAREILETGISDKQKSQPIVTESSIQKQEETVKEEDVRVTQLEDTTQRLLLEKKHPTITREIEDEIAIIAKNKKIGYVEAFEKSPYKELLEVKVREESKKNPIVTPSNRIGFDTKIVQELGAKVMQDNQLDDKEKLVEKVLGLK